MRESRFQSVQLLPSALVLLTGLAIYGLAHASGTVIGEGATRVKDKDYPALCRFDLEFSNSDEGAGCSGTLVGPNEIATSAHCFKKGFDLSYNIVNVSCGGRSARVVSVELPADNLWMNELRPYSPFDYARVRIKKPLSGSIAKAAGPDRYFEDNGILRTGVRCWVGGYGTSASTTFGNLNIAEVSKQSLIYGSGLIVMRNPLGGYLRVSVDHGDSGGALYCMAPGSQAELLGVTVSYRADPRSDSSRSENDFAPIWAQSSVSNR